MTMGKRITIIAACLTMTTALALAAGRVVAQAGAAAAPTDVRLVKLCFDLPAIGNVEAVKKWRFGRIETIGRQGTDDITLDIRTTNGRTHQVRCPAQPFANLAIRSKWMSSDGGATFPSRREVIERMVAFDADESGRIVALTSLEPMERRNRRIADAQRRR